MHRTHNTREIVIYAIVAIAALAIGYVLAQNYAVPAKTGDSMLLLNITDNTQGTNNVQVSQEKISKLKSALEAIFTIQSNQNVTLVYNGYTDNGQFLTFNFTFSDGTAFPGIIASRDMVYLYGDERSLMKLDDIYTQAQVALAQAGAQAQQPVQELIKSDKPVVELFIMSSCPYGVQMEKAIMPVQELLGEKADISIKFVNYILHGAKETQENTRQYCIGQNNPDEFWAYLACFAGNGNASACMANASINETAISACMAETYTTYGISDSGTEFPIYSAENTRYGVRGSPTLVINGAVVNVARSPEEIKKAICSAFITAPEECNTVLSTAQASAGFGYGTSSAPSSGGCGA